MPNRPLNDEYADLLGEEPDSTLVRLIHDLDALYTSAHPPAASQATLAPRQTFEPSPLSSLMSGIHPDNDAKRGEDPRVRTGQIAALPNALPSRRQAWFRYVGEIAAALLVLVLVAGAMAALISTRSPVSSALRSGIERSPTAAPHALAIHPVADSSISGYVDTERLSNGDVRLRATVQGDSHEVSGANLMWMVATDTCTAWTAPQGHVDPGSVLWRFNAVNPQADQPGIQHFSLVIPAKQADPPLVLLAFKNGGGPILACADLGDLANAGSDVQAITLPAGSEQYAAAGDRIVLHAAPQPPTVSQQTAMDIVAGQYPTGPWGQPNTAPSSEHAVRAWYGVVSIEKPAQSQSGWWSSEGETLVWLIDYEYDPNPSPGQTTTATSAPAFTHIVYAVDVEARKVAWWHPYDSP